LAAVQTPFHASDILVTDAASLSSAIASAGSGDRILIQNNVNLSGTLLPPVNSNITIDGQGHTISAQGNNRVFFLDSTATTQNVTLDGGKTSGGSSAAGGGGLGAGGAIFVNSGTTTVSGVSFSNNSAVGATVVRPSATTAPPGAVAAATVAAAAARPTARSPCCRGRAARVRAARAVTVPLPEWPV
jgi:hypothetical protein